MKIKYQCDFCWDTFYSETECLNHEKNDCPENKKIRSCTTCINQTEDMGGTGKIYFGCEKKLIETSPRAYKKNCDGWETYKT